jgi:hypothetical protein
MPSIHADGGGTTCSQPARFPLGEDDILPVGAVVDGVVTLCWEQGCFSLDPILNLWVEFPPLDVESRDADSASVVTPAGWWITGEPITLSAML